EELKNQRLDKEITILFTADRGLALGEHGIIGDWQPWLHDEVVHIPLIVRQPKTLEAGRRVAVLTQTADVAASLLEMFGLEPSAMDGKSWLPLLSGEQVALRDHCIMQWKRAETQERALRTLDS